MFDRFNDGARKAMVLARQQAQRFNHEYIGTEHILLGLIQEGSGLAASVLKPLNVEMSKIRLEVEKLVQPGPPSANMGQLPFTPRAARVIELAVDEAARLGHEHVGSEHLLLGLILEEDGVAAQVLLNLGLKLPELRAAILRAAGCETPAGERAVTVEIPVRWGDMDALGHVNHAVFFQYCEVARFAVFSALRLDECRTKPGEGPGLVRAELNFRRQVKYPAVVAVEARVTGISERSFTIAYTVRDLADGAPVADGSSVCVWVDYDGPKALPLPAALRSVLADWRRCPIIPDQPPWASSPRP